MANSTFRPAWWLPGPHLPTIYGKLVRELAPAPTVKAHWPTPDGDRLAVHQLPAPTDQPHLIVLHGLEGGAHSQYAQGLLHQAHRRGWGATLVVWRTCDEPVNAVRRAYHSGETTDLQFVVERLAAEAPGRPLVLAGVSLGGNVLCKWLGERGDVLPAEVRAAAAVSVPYDLAAASRHIDSGIRRVYSRFFLKTLVAKTLAKAERFPDLVDVERLRRARTLWDFDDVATAPIHGFRDAADYYARSSSIGFLAGIRRPTLLFNAVDDPFLPPAVLDRVRSVARNTPALHVDFPARGGHVGFVGGAVPWRAEYFMERHVVGWLADRLAAEASAPSSSLSGVA